MKELEKTMKALANRRRLTILKFLKREGRATVTDISKEIELSFRATSKHLRVLSAADIIERNQIGLQMWYEVATKLPDGAKPILTLL